MSRVEHEFRFAADTIAKAAQSEQAYHEARLEYWQGEFDRSLQTVRETASLEVKEQNVTGGKRMDVVVNYGDPAAYRRLNEAASKIDSHRKAAERFGAEAHVYGTQEQRDYELSAEDVHYFRLGGGEREE